MKGVPAGTPLKRKVETTGFLFLKTWRHFSPYLSDGMGGHYCHAYCPFIFVRY